MCRAFPGSEYYDGSAPSAPFGRRRAYPLSPSWLNGSAWNEPRTVPTFTVVRSTGEAPGFTPAASPRLRRRPSPRPPDPGLCYPAESSPSSTTDDRCAPPPSPYPPDLSWSRLKRCRHRFLAYAFPSRSPGPTNPAVLGRPDFVAAAPALPGVPRIRLPPASPGRYDGPAMKDSHLHSDKQRLVAHHSPRDTPPPPRPAPSPTGRRGGRGRRRPARSGSPPASRAGGAGPAAEPRGRSSRADRPRGRSPARRGRRAAVRLPGLRRDRGHHDWGDDSAAGVGPPHAQGEEGRLPAADHPTHRRPDR